MSYHDYLPNSFASPIFIARSQPDGINQRLAQAIAEMKHGAFANAEVDRHFFRRNENTWSDNYNFRDPNAHCFTANVFGEILGSAHGTFLGAQGNHYLGNDSNNVSLSAASPQMCLTFFAAEPID